MEYGILGLIILVANIYAIYQVLTSHESTTAKALWTIGILIFPVVGLVAWLLAGPRGGARHA